MDVAADSNNVTVADGVYSTFLGDQTNSGNFASALTNAQVYVEIAVNGVALAPRERIASVAYALNAGNAATVGSLPIGALATGTPVYVESDPIWNGASNGVQSQITAEIAARIGADAALTNLISNEMAERIGADAALTNLISDETAARIGADAALTNLISDETSARIGSDAALSNSVASLTTNVVARLDSNVWAAADSTTNYTRRTGDTMTGALALPPGGLSVGQTQLLVTAAGNIISTGTVTAAGFIGSGAALTGISGGSIATGTITSAALANGAVTSNKLAANAVTTASMADGAVSGAKIASNTITTANVADGGLLAQDLRPSFA